jgi:hypothetical protein
MKPLTWALKEVDPVGTQAVMHTCSGNFGIVKILRYIRSVMYDAPPYPPLANETLYLSTHKHNGKPAL